MTIFFQKLLVVAQLLGHGRLKRGNCVAWSPVAASVFDCGSSTGVVVRAVLVLGLPKSMTTCSQKVNVGKPSDLTASSNATISLSMLLCETAFCLLENAVIGTKVCGPTMAMNMPEVDFESLTSSAKDASTYSNTWQSSGASPMKASKL